jgi:hypothetical protein
LNIDVLDDDEVEILKVSKRNVVINKHQAFVVAATKQNLMSEKCDVNDTVLDGNEVDNNIKSG